METEELHEAISCLLTRKANAGMAVDNQRSIENKILKILRGGSVPNIPWKDAEVRYLFAKFAVMDGNIGASYFLGEREGTIINSNIADRNLYFAHGLGRSGDLIESQPKAPGASVIGALARRLALDFLRNCCGMKSVSAVLLTPVATGMSLNLCLRYILRTLEKKVIYNIVWSRIDQGSAYKSLIDVNTEITAVPQSLENGINSTNIKVLEETILNGSCDIVISTTSCFAPRGPDDVLAVALLAKRYGVPHIVNNAYGLISPLMCSQLQKAMAIGRVDFSISSLDKNFGLPVGGALVFSSSKLNIEGVAQFYPGRASISPSLDFITNILTLSKLGWQGIGTQRVAAFSRLKEVFTDDRIRCFFKLLKEHPFQDVSLAFLVSDTLIRTQDEVGVFGSMLYRRGVSGARVLWHSPGCSSVQRGDGDLKETVKEKWGGHGIEVTGNGAVLVIAAGCAARPQDYDGLASKIAAVCKKRLLAIKREKLRSPLTKQRSKSVS